MVWREHFGKASGTGTWKKRGIDCRPILKPGGIEVCRHHGDIQRIFAEAVKPVFDLPSPENDGGR